jgi:hypothetical protein
MEREVLQAVAEQQDEQIKRAIRKADSYLHAVTALMDAQEAGYPAEPDPDYWPAIREHVFPLLEAEAAKATEEVERLKGGDH